jgi:hypothetical protein
MIGNNLLLRELTAQLRDGGIHIRGKRPKLVQTGRSQDFL